MTPCARRTASRTDVSTSSRIDSHVPSPIVPSPTTVLRRPRVVVNPRVRVEFRAHDPSRSRRLLRPRSPRARTIEPWRTTIVFSRVPPCAASPTSCRARRRARHSLTPTRSVGRSARRHHVDVHRRRVHLGPRARASSRVATSPRVSLERSSRRRARRRERGRRPRARLSRLHRRSRRRRPAPRARIRESPGERVQSHRSRKRDPRRERWIRRQRGSTAIVVSRRRASRDGARRRARGRKRMRADARRRGNREFKTHGWKKRKGYRRRERESEGFAIEERGDGDDERRRRAGRDQVSNRRGGRLSRRGLRARGRASEHGVGMEFRSGHAVVSHATRRGLRTVVEERTESERRRVVGARGVGNHRRFARATSAGRSRVRVRRGGGVMPPRRTPILLILF